MRTASACAVLLLLAAAPAAAQIESRIPIALFVAPIDEQSVEAAAVVEQIMGENVGAYRGFRLLEPEAALSAADYERNQKRRQEARTRLAKGKASYENLDLDEAIKKLTSARTDYEKGALFVNGQKEYLDVLSLLGAALVLSGAEAAGTEVFRRIVAVSPAFVLDPQVFPPKILERWNAAVREMKGTPRCLISVEANLPGARVYVDGAFRGAAPVRAEDLSCGEHAVALRANGYQPFLEKVNVGAGDVSAAVSAQMVPQAEGEKMLALVARIAGEPFGDAVPEPIAELGRWLGADQAIAATVRKTGDQVTVTVAIYDLIGKARVKGNRQTFPRYAPTFAHDLDLFTASLYLDIGGKTIATFTGSEDLPDAHRAAPGKKASVDEPIYKKWWFWAGLIVVVGVAVGVPVGIYAGKSGTADPVERGPSHPLEFDPFTHR